MDEVCEMSAHQAQTQDIEEILKAAKTIAIVGLSPKEDRDSNRVARYLLKHGYKIIPVNPMHSTILGLKSYANLNEIPNEIDVVDIFRKPDAISELVDDAIEKGAKVVWMQLGIVHNEAAKKAMDAGLKVVMNKCMKIEHSQLKDLKKES